MLLGTSRIEYPISNKNTRLKLESTILNHNAKLAIGTDINPDNHVPPALLLIWSTWFLPSLWQGCIFSESQKLSSFLIRAISTQGPQQFTEELPMLMPGWNYCRPGTHTLLAFCCLTWEFENPLKAVLLTHTANSSFFAFCVRPNLHEYLRYA